MQDKPHILMVSTSYPETGEDWRGRFIANLAGALGRRDDLALTLWAPPGDLPPGVAGAATRDDAAWLKRLAQRGGIAHLLREEKAAALIAAAGLLSRLRRVYRRQEADVMHVNWLQNALPLWGDDTPAVIAVLGSDFGLLRLPGMRMLLRAMLRQRRAILAPNADWMRPLLERHFGDLAEVHPVPFGVDRAWFDLPRKIPSDGTSHWLAVTRITQGKIGDLFQWGEGLFGTRRRLHLFGPLQERMTLPSWVEYHGPTHPGELQGWFPKAAGLVTLSRHDEGRPQVMLEAMAARLPIIASDLPAHRDLLQHGHTGWLAESPQGLRDGLEWLEDSHRNLAMGRAAQEWVKSTIGTWDDCAGRYADIYKRLQGSRP